MLLLAFAFVLLQGSPAGLIRTPAAYLNSIHKQPQKQMVDIQKHVPTICLDIRYASTRNFTGQKLYPYAQAWARRIVVDCLAAAQRELATHGLGLKVFDAYRPYNITRKMYAIVPNKVFLAPPQKGSRHNRGCAIDITLVHLPSCTELPMPTGFDVFSPKAFPYAHIQNRQARKNRDLLIQVMHKHGFEVSRSEWWHFDFRGWAAYELLDLSFDQLRTP